MHPDRPHPDEYALQFAGYVARVPDGAIVAILSAQLDATLAHLGPLSRAQVLARPTPADWNVLEMVGHITDGEQIFTYRALRTAPPRRFRPALQVLSPCDGYAATG